MDTNTQHTQINQTKTPTWAGSPLHRVAARVLVPSSLGSAAPVLGERVRARVVAGQPRFRHRTRWCCAALYRMMELEPKVRRRSPTDYLIFGNVEATRLARDTFHSRTCSSSISMGCFKKLFLPWELSTSFNHNRLPCAKMWRDIHKQRKPTVYLCRCA